MGVLGRIFGTDKAIDNIIDKDSGLLAKVGGFIGDQQFTSEEKSRFVLKQLEAIAPFKVVQRILVFAVALLWVVGGLSILIAIPFASEEVIQSYKDFLFSQYILYPTFAVFGLYFGGGFVESAKRKVGK